MQIKILAEGGEMKPGPALSQKLGPAGIPLNEVIKKVNEATKSFQGMKVPVVLDVNPSTKEFSVEVFSPPISELLKKELGVDKGSGSQKKFKCANASIEQIISVAKTKFPNLLCKDLKAAVKITLGSCLSLGILVESKSPVEVISEVEEGLYDSEISQEKIETPEEKKKILDSFFNDLKVEQDKKLKIEKDAEKEAEEKKQKGVKAPEKPK
ncbi:50S ribosomal protein L11 [Patescibacteria group bacterium]|nr:50S ribosomal protein L11 [Patescibacteria group bacterium]